MAHPINKLLIANRGEIAMRIIRAARELGISTVAVYSDADRRALHVLHADEAYRLGPPPASESYLRGDLILQIAKQSGADAIHPGYGFLSENTTFAESCEQAGIIFVGPSASAMRQLGSKTSARQLADAAGVPRVPGTTTAATSPEDALAAARKIGFPVMLKAAAGGGGKGMRAVERESDLASALAAAQSEAQRAFGSSDVYLEKLIVRPRHIEIQVLGDQHGNVVYLGERECSVQRRHQKVIEEAPSAVVNDSLRRRMGETAIALAKQAGYSNAGTAEFLVDADHNFYFLEMNTRLQVEHPVTELVTGLDLVHLQLHVAAGEPLPFTQQQVQIRGHAIECRIYAEDPDNNFFPSPGTINALSRPSGAGIREDCGIYQGWTVPLDYDPMLSKLITYAPTRSLAIERMRQALNDYFIGGIATNISLFQRILSDPDFQAANIDTSYLDRLLALEKRPGSANTSTQKIVAIAAAIFSNSNVAAQTFPAITEESSWKQAARREGLS